MATPTNVIAFCVLRYLYEQVSDALGALKKVMLGIIMYIDTQIAKLKAVLMEYDFLAKKEQFLYDLAVEQTQLIKDAVLSFKQGPLEETCPEFYSYIFDPAVDLLDATMSVFSNIRSRYKGSISFMTQIEKVLQYWELTKTDLLHLVDVTDDAIHHALLREAAPLFP